MRDYLYYLFDADGTLIDTMQLICRCFENTALQTGHKYGGDSETLRYIGLPLKNQMEVYFGKLDDSTFEKYRSIHMDYQMSIYKKYLKLFPDVYDVLNRLKQQGKKLAIVTSRLRNSLDVYLGETGVLSLFDAIVSPELTKVHKPESEPALKAMELLGAVSPSDTLFVGDATYDIECGKNAGTDTAFVNWSINDVSTLRVNPTWVIKDMKELIV